MLDDWGIKYDTTVVRGCVYIDVFSRECDFEIFDNQSNKVKGWSNFFTRYVFDKDGILKEMGAYE